jgi:hypothetical protein
MTSGFSDWFGGLATSEHETGALVLAARLAAAALLGGVVSFVHLRTSDRPVARSFRVTLVLLTILIAAVTQVIGDNVARAFSLVGALSIVRFRTVVRDTRDTVFVIFSVTVGMAVGAGDFVVSFLALVVVGVAAMALAAALPAPRSGRDAGTRPWRLTVRVTLGRRPDSIVAPVFARNVDRASVVRVATAKGGAAIEAAYDIWLRPGADPAAVVEELNAEEGVQATEIEARTEELPGV